MWDEGKMTQWPSESEFKAIWQAAQNAAAWDEIDPMVLAEAPHLLDKDWAVVLRENRNDEKEMWQRIKADAVVTRSVPPNITANSRYKEQLAERIKNGWTVISEGPSGAQLVGEKKMRVLDKACLAFGILTFWIYGIGVFFIIIALIDYWLLTKKPTYFLPAD